MTPIDLKRIECEARISAILSLQHDECLAYWNIDTDAMCCAAQTRGIALLRCPIRDFDIADMRRRLPQAVNALSALVSDQHRVYVHCTAGMGRSPLVVLAYLITIECVPPDRAWRTLLKVRPEAVPSPEALNGFRHDMVARCRDRIAERAYQFYEQGLHHNAHRDWCEAEKEIVRSVLREGVD